VAAEARLDENLLPIIGLGKLEKKDFGVEIVDVCQAQRDKRFGKLVCDDL
jgi:hypothetical protein